MVEKVEVLFEQWPIPMEFPITIASEELSRYRFRSIVGSSGVKWYVPTDDSSDHPGDNLYCTQSANWDESGSGFSGRTLDMRMGDGTVERLKGGWHSNAEAFYQDTGEDLRDKHKTYVVIAKRRDAEYLYEVVYADSEPQVSGFRRGEELAKEYATKLNQPVVSFSRSAAGAVIGQVYP